jgi:hypothetical protein
LSSASQTAGGKGGVMMYASNPLMDPVVVDQVVNLLEITDGQEQQSWTLKRSRGRAASAFGR